MASASDSTPAKAAEYPLVSDRSEVIAQYVRGKLAGQPWWKKSANTVTAAVGGLVALAWWITSTGVDLPVWATWIVGVVLVAGQVVGVRMTKNGVTRSTERDLDEAAHDPTILDLFATITGR